MLINCDVKGLEVVAAAQLSGDTVLSQEIIEKQDIHGNNQTAFNLPSRLIAKVFKFRLIYGGSAYSYSTDSDFRSVGLDERGWQEVIDKYYSKYKGIAEWHRLIEYTAKDQGYLEIPSGRRFSFEYETNKWGKLKWPSTKVKNYPVQGFGADLVKLARLEANRRLTERSWNDLVSTVHDSLVADSPEDRWQEVARILHESVEAVPKLCKQVWDYDFTLPLTSEVSYGKNLKDLTTLSLS